MGCFQTNLEKEQCLIKGSSPTIMSKKIVDKLSDTIVRIELGKKISTGFFMKIKLDKKLHNFLLTCAHSIPQQNIDSKSTIKIFYEENKQGKKQETEKEIKLDSDIRFMKCFKNLNNEVNLDVTVIEIIPEDKIPEDKYLYPDLNYKNGYDLYVKTQIFAGGYPNVDVYKGDKHFSSGTIKSIKENDKNTFWHNCDTREGSSGSPLLNIEQKVIGIHYGCNEKNTQNYGTFVGVIIDLLNSEEDKIIYMDNSNKEDKNIKEDENNNNIEGKNFKDDKENNKIIKIQKKKKKKNKDEKQNQNINDNDKEDEKKKKDDKEDEKIVKIDKNDVLVNMLSEGEKNNKKVKPISESDMALIGSIFNNPSFITLIRTLYKNPIMAEYLNNTPEIKRLKEKNPIFKEVLANPELMDKLFTPELFNTFFQMYSMINKDKEENKKNNEIKEDNDNLLNQQTEINNLVNNMNILFGNQINNNSNLLNQQKDKNNILNNNNNANSNNFGNQVNNNSNPFNQQIDMNNTSNDNNNSGLENELLNIYLMNEREKMQKKLDNIDESYDPVKYHDKFIELKNLGFKNEILIKQALVLYDGNLEKAKEYLEIMDEDP